ncbi:MAG: hypothetical protein FJZ64_05030, partial [Chlamydiae bacterium]|nr:hypothetical protein [Chlamydiota bacterium]
DCFKHPIILQLEALKFTPFHVASLLLFALAIIHTLYAHKVKTFARKIEMKESRHLHKRRHARTALVQLLYFLGEVEIIFAFWVIPLLFAMVYAYGWKIGVEYLNTRDYTEPLFVAVILSLTATKPIIRIAEHTMTWCAKWLSGSLSAWWLTLLTLGPLLGSFITEVGAMTLCALLLSRQFYQFHPSQNLSYATLALLFVNVSVGGILTDFASPAVLILAHCWHWTTADMFLLFGWKAMLGIVTSNLIYWFWFRKEFKILNEKKRKLASSTFLSSEHTNEENVPLWIMMTHILFIVWIVCVAQYTAVFIASFLFFIGFHQATRRHQYPIRIVHPMLVGLFLAGLIIHGGLQGWWVVQLLHGLSPLSVMGVSILLTGFNDNTAISYLATLVPDWGPLFKYAIFTGVIAGGGLTVISNAPNPAGYAILKRHLGEGIQPIKLFLMALIPTCILYLIFFWFSPLS